MKDEEFVNYIFYVFQQNLHICAIILLMITIPKIVEKKT